MLSLPSCALFRPATSDGPQVKDKDEMDPITSRRQRDPETGAWVIVEQTMTERMDTIRWRDVPKDSLPPITSESEFATETGPGAPEFIRQGEFNTRFFTSYNVALILPFLGDRYQASSDKQIPEQSSWALNFYGGVRMALDQLSDEGVNLKVTVMDSRASQADLSRLLRGRSELFNSHLIIGPYRRENVAEVAAFAKRQDITFVSPYSAASNIASDNPNYIQVSPPLETHCIALTRDACRNFNPRKIVLVGRDADSESARFVFFQEENYRLAGTRHDSVKLREFIIREKDGFQNLNFAPYLNGKDTVVFILPSFNNEPFVFSFLSQLKAARPVNTHVAVYGMPQWMSFERIDLDLYENLNVRVSSDSYLDPYDADANFFRQRFFDRHGVVPPVEAFLGYDVMLYFGRMIHKNGTKFQYFLEREPQRALHTRFDFERVAPPGAAGRESSRIDRFENKFVHILRFRDYMFQP